MDSTTITPPGPPWTWENITPEQYETSPFTQDWPWCQPGQFPVSYAWEAPCIDVDPCQTGPDGSATLWAADLCDPATHPYVIGLGAGAPDCDPAVTFCGPINGPATVGLEPFPTDPTTTIAEIGDPPQLPATGLDETFGVVGAVIVVVGLFLVWMARR